MKNQLPTVERFSQKILKDLYKNREDLMKIESSSKPYCHLIDPLLDRDRKLSEILVYCLIHELDLNKKDVKE